MKYKVIVKKPGKSHRITDGKKEQITGHSDYWQTYKHPTIDDVDIIINEQKTINEKEMSNFRFPLLTQKVYGDAIFVGRDGKSLTREQAKKVIEFVKTYETKGSKFNSDEKIIKRHDSEKTKVIDVIKLCYEERKSESRDLAEIEEVKGTLRVELRKIRNQEEAARKSAEEILRLEEEGLLCEDWSTSDKDSKENYDGKEQ